MSKITELRPQTGGGSDNPTSDAIIIEKVDNGYILRCLQATDNPEVQLEECRVYTDRAELMRDVAARL
jgi:hypothetical protein